MKQINRTFIIAGGLALSGVIVAGLAIAGQSGHFGHRKHIQSFQALSLDKNGDGMLTRDEMLAKNEQRFLKLDADGDGTISQDEFSAHLAALFDKAGCQCRRHAVDRRNTPPHQEASWRRTSRAAAAAAMVRSIDMMRTGSAVTE
jgi:hypothetical protein